MAKLKVYVEDETGAFRLAAITVENGQLILTDTDQNMYVVDLEEDEESPGSFIVSDYEGLEEIDPVDIEDED